MEFKSLLTSFWRLINVLRISGLQALSVIFVSYSFGEWVVISGFRGCAPLGGYFNFYLWSFLLIGLVATAISVYYILFPAIWMQTIDKQLVFSATDTNLLFFSTQPVYVFLDAVFFIPAIAMFQIGRAETMCQFNFEWGFGSAFLLMAIAYPLLRAVSWFVLKIRIEAKSVKIPWLTLIMWWLIAIPFVVYVTFNYMENNMLPKLRVPVVNQNTFKGGLEKNPQFGSGIVRVQGKISRGIAKCGLFGKNPEVTPFPSGTIIVDMGKGNGQILVKANRPDIVEMLEYESENRKEVVFEAFGKLSKLPNPEKKLVCGISKADEEQKGGLALLEIEMP